MTAVAVALPPVSYADFPSIRRARLDTLQVNVGYRCNQACTHCHVDAGPKRPEQMQLETAQAVVRFIDAGGISTLDITGGAPELNANFRYLVREARARGLRVIDRCNLTILEEPGHEDLAEFLAGQGVDIVASLPCYLEENVDHQRGKGVYRKSVRGLQRLNALGYGRPDSGLQLELVYNPQGPVLPPPQQTLEEDYKREMQTRFGVVFDRLLTLTNMPVGRFAHGLHSQGCFAGYMDLLRAAHREENVAGVMCRTLLSVDWLGYVYDCDFNQMLDLPLRVNGTPRAHLSELIGVDLEGRSVLVRDHCFGCTAGNGSSCGGALS